MIFKDGYIKFHAALLNDGTVWTGRLQYNSDKYSLAGFDGEYPAKDSLGALDGLPDEIPNDLSIVVDKLREVYG